MWCGIYGVKQAEIYGFKKEIRTMAEQFLKPEHGPALAIFYTTERNKLFNDYPFPRNYRNHNSPKLPATIKLGDDPSETYSFGIFTRKGFYIYQDGEFTSSHLKNYYGDLSEIIRYLEYLQDPTDRFHLYLWGCEGYPKNE